MTLFSMEFRLLRKPLLWWSVLCGVLLAFFMLFYPSMQNADFMELLEGKMDFLPEGMRKMFNLDVMPDFSQIDQFFAYVAQFFLMAAAVYAGMLGAHSLIKEETDGTIEFLYAHPISRTKILCQKLLASLCIYGLFVGGQAVLTTAFFAFLTPEGQDTALMIRHCLQIYGGFFLVGATFLGIGFFLSTLLSGSRQAGNMVLGLVFFSYLLGIFSSLIDGMGFIRYLSPLHYFLPNDILLKGFSMGNMGILMGVFLVCILASLLLYRKKDFHLQ